MRQQGIITPQQEKGIDALFSARWEALLSVDDLVEGIVAAVEEAGQSDRTYLIYTSDHGYQLGELRLPSCKLNPLVVHGAHRQSVDELTRVIKFVVLHSMYPIPTVSTVQ